MTACQQADIFLVPLLDGAFGLGQVIIAPDDRRDTPYWPTGAAFCLLTARHVTRSAATVPVSQRDIISRQFIDAGVIGTDIWPVIGFEQLPPVAADPDQIALRHDVTPIDAPIIEAFLNACHGLFPWDGFPDPAFFDAMLAAGVDRPARATLAK